MEEQESGKGLSEFCGRGSVCYCLPWWKEKTGAVLLRKVHSIKRVLSGLPLLFIRKGVISQLTMPKE